MQVGDLVKWLDEDGDIGIIVKIETGRLASVLVEWSTCEPHWHEPEFLEVMNESR